MHSPSSSSIPPKEAYFCLLYIKHMCELANFVKAPFQTTPELSFNDFEKLSKHSGSQNQMHKVWQKLISFALGGLRSLNISNPKRGDRKGDIYVVWVEKNGEVARLIAKLLSLGISRKTCLMERIHFR